MGETQEITYHFAFADGTSTSFVVTLTLPTRQVVCDARAVPPSWAELGFHQCPNCPLSPDVQTHCPVARNLAPVIDAFRARVSSEEASIRVQTAAREYARRGPLQIGLSSLVGLIMAGSDCPVLAKLRPMVFTHLPFSDAKETTFRAISTYLLTQCIRERQGRSADWSLGQLTAWYDAVRKVNRAFAGRLRAACERDAGINAMVLLDTFAGRATFALSKEWWKELEPLFAPMEDGRMEE
jgi:hypothetical protein